MAYEPFYYRLKKTHPSPDGIIRSVTGIVGAGLGGVCLVGILFTEEIFAVLLAPEYRAASSVTPLILASYLLHGINLQLKKPLFYHRRTSLIPWLTVAPGLVTLGLCFVLIPSWGMMAAVWLTFANHLAVSLLIGAANRRLSPGQYPLERLALCLWIVVAGAVWVTYAGAGWIPATAPVAKAAFLAGYTVAAWLLLVRDPLAVLQQALPATSAESMARAGSPR
jgi:O-antigen/teichoic acid export membrane protein